MAWAESGIRDVLNVVITSEDNVWRTRDLNWTPIYSFSERISCTQHYIYEIPATVLVPARLFQDVLASVYKRCQVDRTIQNSVTQKLLKIEQWNFFCALGLKIWGSKQTGRNWWHYLKAFSSYEFSNFANKPETVQSSLRCSIVIFFISIGIEGLCQTAKNFPSNFNRLWDKKILMFQYNQK